MKIHLRQIPAGGLHLEGEEDCPLPQLNPEEARCAGPLRYSLDVGISGNALWAKGQLTQPVELRCVSCLAKFPFDIEVKDFAIHTDLAGPEEVDLTPFMREDIMLTLPAYPHCDREGGRVCAGGAAPPHTESGEGEPDPPTDWSALDKLKIEKS